MSINDVFKNTSFNDRNKSRNRKKTSRMEYLSSLAILSFLWTHNIASKRMLHSWQTVLMMLIVKWGIIATGTCVSLIVSWFRLILIREYNQTLNYFFVDENGRADEMLSWNSFLHMLSGTLLRKYHLFHKNGNWVPIGTKKGHHFNRIGETRKWLN